MESEENPTDMNKDHSKDTTEEGEPVCHSCSKTFDSDCLFRCKTCAMSMQLSNKNQTVKLFCKMCIVVLHMRKNHEIIDHRGYEPAKCNKHENLCHYFCEDCQNILCADCIETHIGHKLQTISVKAREVRKEVFNYLYKNEEFSKPVNFRHAIIQDCFDTIPNKDKLTEEKNLAKVLRTKCKKIISANAAEYSQIIAHNHLISTQSSSVISEEDLEKIRMAFTETSEKDVSLRTLLQLSDGNLIKKFQDSFKQLQIPEEDQENQFPKHIFLQKKISLDECIENAFETAMESFQIPQIEVINMQEIQLNAVKNLITSGREVHCRNLKISKLTDTRSSNFLRFQKDPELLNLTLSKNRNFFNLLSLEHRVPSIETVVLKMGVVEHVFYHKGFLAIAKLGAVFVFHLKEEEFVSKIKLLHGQTPLALNVKNHGTFSCLTWSSKKLAVEFAKNKTSRPKVTLKMEQKPELVEHIEKTFALKDAENKVTIWHPFQPRRNSHIELSRLHHGLCSIDKIKLVDDGLLFLFDYKRLLVVNFKFDITRKSSSNCSLEKVLKICPVSDKGIFFMTVLDDSIFAQSVIDGPFYQAVFKTFHRRRGFLKSPKSCVQS